MPSTFTTSGIELIATGEQSGVWGDTTNVNLQIIDRLTSQAGTISLSGTTHTLTLSNGTLSDGHFGVLVFGGSPSGTNTVTISPNTVKRIYIVRNISGQTVVLTQGSGGNVSIGNNRGAIVYSDGQGAGAAVVDLTTTFNFQPLDADLTAIAALAKTDGNFIVGNGSTWVAESGATARASLGLGSIATQNSNSVTITGGSITGITDLAVADGGTGASTAANARTNLGLAIGTNVQAWDTNLDQIAALAVTDGNFIVGNGSSWVVESGSTARTSLGLGSIATQNSASVSITGGSITGITDLAIADGGTGASTAANARANLGLGSIATQNSASVSITGGSISGITDLAVADGGTGASTAAAARTNLGLAIGTDVLAYDGNLQGFVNAFTLPTTDGTNGQFLTTNGAGTLQFTTASSTSPQADTINVTTSTTSSAFKIPFANTTASTTGYYGLLQDSTATFTYNPSTNTLTVGTVSGALSGNASTATALQTARTIGGVSFDGTANINLPGVNITGNQNTTGSAASLTTARTINGTSFNGTANITTATWGTSRTLTIGNTGKSVNGSANASWSLSEIGALPLTGGTLTGAVTVPEITNTGTSFWQVSAADAAVQRVDALDDATNFARLHWYGTSDAGATSNFRHAWYDGSSYIDVTANSGGRIDFTGSAASMYIGSDRVFNDGYHPNADTLTTARTINGTSFDGSANITTANWGAARTIWGQSINGSANITAPVLPAAGSVTAPAFSTSGDTNTGIYFSAADVMNVTTGGTLAATFAANGDFTAVGNVTAYSDARLKTDIQPIPDALTRVMSLTGYTYTRIDSGERHTGVLAQDVQRVLPEAVSDDGKHLSVAYGNMVGLLVEAIKEQQAQIEALKARLDD